MSQASPGVRSRLSAERRREAILEAAKRVFGQAGYHEATTRDIAAAAGVSEALLYQHFPGKRQLFEAVMGEAAADLERVATASRAQRGGIRIDDVLLFIDRGLENMPSYLDLFRRWEKQQWAVSELDFAPDREHWLTSTQLGRDATLWGRRLFFTGE